MNDPRAVLTAFLLMFVGSALAIAGVFVLHGLGWALLTGVAPCFVVAWVILRGLS